MDLADSILRGCFLHQSACLQCYFFFLCEKIFLDYGYSISSRLDNARLFNSKKKSKKESLLFLLCDTSILLLCMISIPSIAPLLCPRYPSPHNSVNLTGCLSICFDFEPFSVLLATSLTTALDLFGC